MPDVYRLLTHAASPGGARGNLLVFYFHRVLAEADPMRPGEPLASQFDRIVGWIAEQYRVLPPDEGCERLMDASLPPRAAIISFDDGYLDNHDIALSILKAHRLPAVFFVASGYLGRMEPFNDRVTEALRAHGGPSLDASQLGLGRLPTRTVSEKLFAVERLLDSIKYLQLEPRDEAVARIETACGCGSDVRPRQGRLMMRPEEVRAMRSAGMQIGAHTRSHPILRSLPDADAIAEIEGGRDDLAAVTGEQPLLFAYPNGKHGVDFELSHADMVVRAGFRFAFTTDRGVATRASDPMMLPRYMPWQNSAMRFKLQALRQVFLGTGAGGRVPRPVAT